MPAILRKSFTAWEALAALPPDAEDKEAAFAGADVDEFLHAGFALGGVERSDDGGGFLEVLGGVGHGSWEVGVGRGLGCQEPLGEASKLLSSARHWWEPTS